jgi:hypothetical protein
MRYYIILFFSVLSFLFSCNHSGTSADVIPPDQMTALLTQVYLVDGRLSALEQYPDTLYKYGTARYLAVFKQFNTDSAQFRKSCIYYSSNPQQLLDMNVKILAALQLKSDSLRKLMNKQMLKVNQHNSTPVSTFHAGASSANVQAMQHSATTFHPGAVQATQHPVSTFHPGATQAAQHPVSTFHPGAAPAMQQPVTVLSHGKVVQTNSPMSSAQRLQIKQVMIKTMKAKRDSIRAKQHH